MKIEQKIISEENIFHGKVFDVNRLMVELPDERVGVYDVVTSPDACAILAMDKDNNVILVRQFRPSTKRIMLEIPAGKIDEGEEPIKCAIRELREETGHIAHNIEKMFEMYMTPGYCTEKIHVYKAEKLGIGDTDFDEDEFIDTVKLPIEEVKKLIQRGEIQDAKTIAAIMAVT